MFVTQYLYVQDIQKADNNPIGKNYVKQRCNWICTPVF